MMVEAGAKIVPEDVMAEAIMFGHRSLAPIIDLQEQLREQVGKAKRMPYIEPSVESMLDVRRRGPGQQAFVVFDVETTSRDVKLGSIVEIGAVKVNNGKIEDRWSTLVNPGRPIVGRQLTASRTRTSRTPGAAEAAQQFLDWAGDALLVGHNVGFDIGFLEAALGGGQHIEPGRYLDTLVLAREAYPDTDLKLGDLAASSSSRSSRTTAPCRTPRQPRSCSSVCGSDLPGRIRPTRRQSPTRSARQRSGTTSDDDDKALDAAPRRRASRRA